MVKRKSKKGIVQTVRGRIPYSRRIKKSTVLGGRVANTRQGIKNTLYGGPGGWSTSKKAYKYSTPDRGLEIVDEFLPAVACLGDCARNNLGHRLGLNKSTYRRKSYRRATGADIGKGLNVALDEAIPTVTCSIDCLRSNLGHRLGLNKSKYRRRC